MSGAGSGWDEEAQQQESIPTVIWIAVGAGLGGLVIVLVLVVTALLLLTRFLKKQQRKKPLHIESPTLLLEPNSTQSHTHQLVKNTSITTKYAINQRNLQSPKIRKPSSKQKAKIEIHNPSAQCDSNDGTRTPPLNTGGRGVSIYVEAAESSGHTTESPAETSASKPINQVSRNKQTLSSYLSSSGISSTSIQSMSDRPPEPLPRAPSWQLKSGNSSIATFSPTPVTPIRDCTDLGTRYTAQRNIILTSIGELEYVNEGLGPT